MRATVTAIEIDDNVFDFAKMTNDKLYIIIKFMGDVFTLKGFRINMGHDDSLPFQAVLCINGKETAECYNDGWGGPTNIHPLSLEKRESLYAIDALLKNYTYTDSKYNLTSKWSIEEIVDALSYEMARIE
jgi:hypothetical protein